MTTQQRLDRIAAPLGAGQPLTPEEARIFVETLAQAVIRHVHDTETIRAIGEEFGRLSGCAWPPTGDGDERRSA